jgi:hypothetical protein
VECDEAFGGFPKDISHGKKFVYTLFQIVLQILLYKCSVVIVRSTKKGAKHLASAELGTFEGSNILSMNERSITLLEESLV